MEPLLSEATTDQIIDELQKRCNYMALVCEKPSNEGMFYEVYKGDYVEQLGCVEVMNQKMRYAGQMVCKQEFNDDPDIYFGDDHE